MRSPEDMRTCQRQKIKTLEDIAELVAAEHLRVKLRAKADADAGVVVIDPKTKRRPVAGGVVEISGIDAFAGTGKNGAVNKIDYEYQLWGFSQKVQVAGVRASALCSHCMLRNICSVTFVLYPAGFSSATDRAIQGPSPTPSLADRWC